MTHIEFGRVEMRERETKENEKRGWRCNKYTWNCDDHLMMDIEREFEKNPFIVIYRTIEVVSFSLLIQLIQFYYFNTQGSI